MDLLVSSLTNPPGLLRQASARVCCPTAPSSRRAGKQHHDSSGSTTLITRVLVTHHGLRNQEGSKRSLYRDPLISLLSEMPHLLIPVQPTPPILYYSTTPQQPYTITSHLTYQRYPITPDSFRAAQFCQPVQQQRGNRGCASHDLSNPTQQPCITSR